MSSARTIADVISSGIRLEAHEAGAGAQGLIASGNDVRLTTPLGPPTIDNVVLERDGSVVCTACATTPAVYEIGILLESMLPRGGMVRAPGALRYAMARALHEVDAPPFDTLAECAAALAR